MQFTQVLGGTKPCSIGCAGAVKEDMDMIFDVLDGSGFDGVLLLVIRF